MSGATSDEQDINPSFQQTLSDHGLRQSPSVPIEQASGKSLAPATVVLQVIS